MSESIYYRSRGNIREVLQDAISPLVLGREEPQKSFQIHEEDPGAFFFDERMSTVRRQAVATVAGLIVPRRTVTASHIVSVASLRPSDYRYAQTFLSAKVLAEHSELRPEPTEVFITRTRGYHNVAQYEALPALDLLAEVAEERYPLLHEAIERFSL